LKIFVAVLTLALAAAALCQVDVGVNSLPENPHQSVYIDGMCTVCHGRNDEGQMEPHVFVLPIIEICLRESCHTAAKIGRSHPVGVNARRSSSVEEVPESLPLETATRCYPVQTPELLLTETVAGEEREIPYYKTYYLRVPGDPDEGFTALCNSCHPR
jgi:hypothetical protein